MQRFWVLNTARATSTCWASGTQASTAPQGKPPSDFWIFLKPFRNISNCLLYQVTHHPQKNKSIRNIIFKSWNPFRKLSLLNLHSFCACRQNLSRSAKQSLSSKVIFWKSFQQRCNSFASILLKGQLCSLKHTIALFES